ncbi:oligosaccharide flippase family protein, partial [Neobacillus drentensis]|uniref:oligosaccharide flippase family protein n=1 Tax=Neobacillus drentensis TaxID=220684 RepID=UPI0030034FAA
MRLELKNTVARTIKKNEIVGDTLIVFMGNAFAQGLNFLCIVLLARFFGPENISFYTLTISLLTLLLAIADSGISNSIVNLTNKEREDSEVILLVGFFFRVIIGIAIFLIGIKMSDFLALDIYNNHKLAKLFFYAFLGVIILTVHGFIAT